MIFIEDRDGIKFSKKTLGIDLICHVERYESPFRKRLNRMFLPIGIGTIYL